MLKAQYDEEHPRWNLAVYPVNVQLTLLNPVQNTEMKQWLAKGAMSPRGESLHDVRTESARSEVCWWRKWGARRHWSLVK
jgi:hypothetical protein